MISSDLYTSLRQGGQEIINLLLHGKKLKSRKKSHHDGLKVTHTEVEGQTERQSSVDRPSASSGVHLPKA